MPANKTHLEPFTQIFMLSMIRPFEHLLHNCVIKLFTYTFQVELC